VGSVASCRNFLPSTDDRGHQGGSRPRHRRPHLPQIARRGLQLVLDAAEHVHTLTLIEPPPVHAEFARISRGERPTYGDQSRRTGWARRSRSSCPLIGAGLANRGRAASAGRGRADAARHPATFFDTDLPALFSWRFDSEESVPRQLPGAPHQRQPQRPLIRRGLGPGPHSGCRWGRRTAHRRRSLLGLDAHNPSRGRAGGLPRPPRNPAKCGLDRATDTRDTRICRDTHEHADSQMP
jgi:hypothetical protein